jgi:hypothetical protein
MKKPKKTIILLIIFAALSLVSLIALYATYQIPTQEIVTTTLSSYTSTATYDYVAMLEPNIIYNKTILKPNEGTIYARVTRQINLTLAYTFQADQLTQATTTYNLERILKTGALSYTISSTDSMSTNETEIQIAIPPVNRTELENIKNQIESEAGIVGGSTYALEIAPTFSVHADTASGVIQQTFTPTLTVEFKQTEQGYIITIENLYQTRSGAITRDDTVTRYDMMNQRYATYILTTISLIGLGISAFLHKKTQPKTEKLALEKLIAPYRRLIIETREMPKAMQEPTVVNIGNMKELAKLAEILARPVLHTVSGNEHVFYVVEANTRYEYKTSQE